MERVLRTPTMVGRHEATRTGPSQSPFDVDATAPPHVGFALWGRLPAGGSDRTELCTSNAQQVTVKHGCAPPSAGSRAKPQAMAVRRFTIEQGLLIALTWIVQPSLAWADPLLPPAGLRWSYPANGAVDVPTNADLYFTGDVRSVPWRNAVSLEGQQIAPGVYDLGELLPRQRYRIFWGSEAAIGFATGDGPSPSTPAVIAGLDRDPERRRCNVAGSGNDGAYVVELDFDTPAVATLIDVLSCDGSARTVLWPAECGPPLIGDSNSIVCVRARATLGADLGEPTELTCSLPSDEERARPWYTPTLCPGEWPPAEARTVEPGNAATGCVLSPPHRREKALPFLPPLLALVAGSRRRARRSR